MQKSKLVKIFYSLAPHEKVTLRKWVHSPAFNKQDKVIRLFDYLYDVNIEKDRKLLHRKLVFGAVFGETPFKMSKLRYVCTALTQLCEECLVYQYQTKQDLSFYLDLSKLYQQKGLEKLSEQSLQKAEKIHLQNPLEDIPQLEDDYNLEWGKYEHNYTKGRSNATNLQNINTSFDLAYIAGKLKHSCRVLSHQGMFPKQYDTGLLNNVLGHLEEYPPLLKIPAIGLYYYYYLASTSIQQEEKANYFKKFKQYLIEYQQSFPKSEIKDLYILATNYTIKKINTDQRNYYIQETFDLYKNALAFGVLLENNQISPFAYTNIIAVAIGLKKYAWAKTFMETHQPLLPVAKRKAYTNYNLSRWYFHQQKYYKAEELLKADDFEDIHLNLSAKMLLLKIYYALGEIPLLEALINRFRTYLSRQKGLVYHKKNYGNIIRLTKRLVYINPFSKKAKAKLKKDIESTEMLTERQWLLTQLADL